MSIFEKFFKLIFVKKNKTKQSTSNKSFKEIIETEINKKTVKESKKEVIFEKEIEDNHSNNIKPKQKKRKKNEKK
jgi:hypothetical protein